MGAKIVHSGGNTYFSGGVESQLDYFLVEHSIVGAVRTCYSHAEPSLSKHVACVLELADDFKTQKV